jgi:hypothetical protein
VSRLEPLSDPEELAEVERWANATPISSSPFNRRVTDVVGRVAGWTVREGPAPTNGEGLRDKQRREFAAQQGQARRLLRVECRSCRAVAANWRHVTGHGFLTAAEWEHAQRVRGRDVPRWRGWLWESTTRTAYRDYWDGVAVTACPCGRDIAVNLQTTVLAHLEPRCSECGDQHTEHTRAETLRIEG